MKNEIKIPPRIIRKKIKKLNKKVKNFLIMYFFSLYIKFFFLLLLCRVLQKVKNSLKYKNLKKVEKKAMIEIYLKISYPYSH